MVTTGAGPYVSHELPDPRYTVPSGSSMLRGLERMRNGWSEMFLSKMNVFGALTSSAVSGAAAAPNARASAADRLCGSASLAARDHAARAAATSHGNHAPVMS